MRASFTEDRVGHGWAMNFYFLDLSFFLLTIIDSYCFVNYSCLCFLMNRARWLIGFSSSIFFFTRREPQSRSVPTFLFGLICGSWWSVQSDPNLLLGIEKPWSPVWNKFDLNKRLFTTRFVELSAIPGSWSCWRPKSMGTNTCVRKWLGIVIDAVRKLVDTCIGSS